MGHTFEGTGQSPYEELANAIIYKAVDDYRAARKYLKRHPAVNVEPALADRATRKYIQKRKKRERDLKEIEAFFHSELFTILTRLNPEALLARLKKEEI